ncbi:hypothetical protein CYMTET_55902 [Cymbomonas tetramitiformis]|uniref:ALA-interacting subunit n=1 Tax=Cymbomonas tetramitiformis TaxID=36881 RepID=A0AAE0EMC7_9CHLO|nr:hypothetical protein CYMTET_55902 [Cymbomonas tetramitiformis]|eukprot:gene20494-24563_t
MGDPPLKKEKEPSYSAFTQQQLPACKPLLTPIVVVIVFFTLGVVFIPIGAIALSASRSVVEVVKRYDDHPDCTRCLSAEGVIGECSSNSDRDESLYNTVNGTGYNCTIEIEIEDKMEKPVYMYYELNNFYQNHRRYVKSRSDEQLRGEDPSSSVIGEKCDPKKYQNEDNEEETDIINPCGLVAWSYFNDTYSATRTTTGGDASDVVIDETGIAWKSDVDDKFDDYKATNFNNIPEVRGGGEMGGDKTVNKDEHFIVWMRTATLPNFRKLWGKIDMDLEKGDKLTFVVSNRYNTYRFSGKKKIVLSTTTWLGGKNDFLGIAYLVVGAFCLSLGLVFLAIYLKNPRNLGDASHLSWEKAKRKNLG